MFDCGRSSPCSRMANLNGGKRDLTTANFRVCLAQKPCDPDLIVALRVGIRTLRHLYQHIKARGRCHSDVGAPVIRILLFGLSAAVGSISRLFIQEPIL